MDIASGVENTLRVLQFKIPPGIEIIRDIQFKGTLDADGGGLNQVWTNLLDNALRAMGPSGKLVVRIVQEAQELLVSFTDSGVGIAPRDLERLFQPFFSTRAAGEGTGLGLPLCQRIVLQHQGRIEVTTELGRGSTFKVRLPMKTEVEDLEPRFTAVG